MVRKNEGREEGTWQLPGDLYKNPAPAEKKKKEGHKCRGAYLSGNQATCLTGRWPCVR